MVAFLADLSRVARSVLVPAILLIVADSTFLRLFTAVSVSEVFEARKFSKFFRFPMIFLCGLFFPVQRLPALLRPLSYTLLLTYGADTLHAGFREEGQLPPWLNLTVLAVFCVGSFLISLPNIRRRWTGQGSVLMVL